MMEDRLRRLAMRHHRYGLWCKLGSCWLVAGVVGLLLFPVQHATGWPSAIGVFLLMLLALVAGAVVAVRHKRHQPNWRALALDVEKRYPSLDGRLLTLMHMDAPVGEQGYFYKTLLSEVDQQCAERDWAEAMPYSRLRVAYAAQWFGLIFFALVFFGLFVPGIPRRAAVRTVPGWVVEVTPGDVSLERGSSLVVVARFPASVPPGADLVLGSDPAASNRIALSKSLADPMFGGTVAEVSTNFNYRVEYAGKTSPEYKVTVFEYPKLERANAELKYPEYTHLPDKALTDVRRLSAVEGSRMQLKLELNKPVSTAELIGKNQSIPLTVGTNAVALLSDFELQSSQTYQLRLVDEDGRTNRIPAQFVFEALTNRPPEFKLARPRGDLRPSALEEVSFDGTVWDDFGVESYGIGYSVGGGEPKFVQAGAAVLGQTKAPLHFILSFERLGVRPDELVTWFTWADDLGPDGRFRRTLGDLYFAEVRGFDEVFREGQGMQGQSDQNGEQQQGGSPASKLGDLQKQIISATWKLSHGQPPKPVQSKGSSFMPFNRTRPHEETLAKSIKVSPITIPQVFGQASSDRPPARSPGSNDRPANPRASGSGGVDDTSVVHDSQEQALEQAREAMARQDDPRTATLWAAAIKNMEQALSELEAARSSPERFARALEAERAAYQSLLRLQEHEYQVSRSRNQGRQNSNNRDRQMQRQLDELELSQSEDRYETQRQAQAPQSTERREQLAVQNRLQELARRQQDLNERMKELQTALQEARTEQERQEIQRRLKRLQEQEQEMLTDVDALRQRMERPENQSRTTEQRQQLEQTRQDMQRAADRAGQGQPSEALASGSRAQQQLQEMRDQLRKENSSQFGEDMKQMRSQARELAQQSDQLAQAINSDAGKDHKSLSDSPGQTNLLAGLERQKQLVTNVVERLTQISQQAEPGEPLLSRQLYDTVRKLAQDTGKDVKELQEELLRRGMMPRRLMDQLNEADQPDAPKLMEITSEMLRNDFKEAASESAQRTRARLETLKSGVERAAESVLGDDTEALRLAQDELQNLANQLQKEVAENERSAAAGASTNSSAAAGREGAPEPGQTGVAGGTNATSVAQNGEGRPDATRQGREQAGQAEQQGQGSAGIDGQPSTQQAQSGQQGGGRNRTGQQQASTQRRSLSSNAGGPGGPGGPQDTELDRMLTQSAAPQFGPLTGDDFLPWSDRLRDVEDMVEFPEWRNEISAVRDRARAVRQEFRKDKKQPDWAVVKLQVIKPLYEVRDRIAEELARRGSREALVPVDRDPVPNRYSEMVRRYHEELGRDRPE